MRALHDPPQAGGAGPFAVHCKPGFANALAGCMKALTVISGHWRGTVPGTGPFPATLGD
ncbi:hypothetical protein J3D46_003593 [Paenarthrobacter sp. A20]|nr:hypothetical protein [Paenarthrobacter sp. A20]